MDYKAIKMEYKAHNDTCNKVLDAIKAIQTDDYKLEQLLIAIELEIKNYRNFPTYRIDTLITCIRNAGKVCHPGYCQKVPKTIKTQ